MNTQHRIGNHLHSKDLTLNLTLNLDGEGNSLEGDRDKTSLFRYSPRECDLLYAIWNGVDPRVGAERLGISRAAFSMMILKESFRYEVETYYRSAAISPAETAARLSELGRQ